MKNKKAFTLFELLIVISITSILLLIATDKFIIGAFKSNSRHNQSVDLQNGVKSSIDNIKNVLKSSVQVHLVGKEVYEPNMNLNNLDNRYNYIAFREDGKGNLFLANIIYDRNKKTFDVIPLSASQKKDILNNNDIRYSLKFYKGDNKYKGKLEKNMLNFTVKGMSKAAYDSKQEFELTENLNLPNVNQILISRHLQGGIEDITAIAYDNGIIQPGKQGNGKVGIVFIIDGSQSMQETLDGHFPETLDDGKTFRFLHLDESFDWGKTTGGKAVENKTATFAEITNPKHKYATRRVIAGAAITNFLTKLNQKSVEKGIEVDAYIYKYDSHLLHQVFSDIGQKDDSKNRYLFKIEDLKKKVVYENGNRKEINHYYYKLNNEEDFNAAKTHVTGTCDMSFNTEHYNRKKNKKFKLASSTNTGFAILQGLEILKQLKEQGVDKRFMVLLTDGVPTVASYYAGSKNPDYPKEPNFIVNRAQYNKLPDYITADDRHYFFENYQKNDGGTPMKFIKAVTDPKYGLNEKGVYDKAYLVGFSENKDDKKRLGFPEKNGNTPKNSIAAYLKRAGNEVQTYDSSDSDTLDEALSSVVKDIQVSLSIFEGPNKRKDFSK